MINKKLLICIISVIFAAIVITAGFFAFTVNTIDLNATFITQDEDRDENINAKLGKFVGSNLLFLDVEDIKQTMSDDPFIECISVKKQFPNTVYVELKERKAVYALTADEKEYLIDEDGIVLKEGQVGSLSGGYITLSLEKISVKEAVCGQKIVTDRDFALYNAFEIKKNIDITDCIKVMTVEYKVLQDDVVFDTNTEVKIRIVKSTERGIEKAKKAFELYDNEHSDYVKSFNEIVAYELDGSIVSGWTRHGENS